MLSPANHLILVVPAVVAPLVIATFAPPAVSSATQCGDGTVYDAPSDTCLVDAQAPAPQAPAPPPPAAPAPPPAWGGYYGPRPWVSVSVCAPIPIINICVGI